MRLRPPSLSSAGRILFLSGDYWSMTTSHEAKPPLVGRGLVQEVHGEANVSSRYSTTPEGALVAGGGPVGGPAPAQLGVRKSLSLSYTHIVSRPNVRKKIIARFAVQANHVQVKRMGQPGRGGGKRGTVKSFSRASRSRLMSLMGKIVKHAMPLFVTLTYPGGDENDYKNYKHDLRMFLQSMRRKFSDAAVIWKLEFQQRGVAHYHLFVWGLDENIALDWVAHEWHRLVGRADPNHLKWHLGLLGRGNVPCVQKIRTWQGVVHYAGKYMSKLQTTTEGKEEKKFDVPSGRYWGQWGDVPISKMIDLLMPEEVAANFRRYVRRSFNKHSFKRGLGFWIYADPVQWMLIADAMLTEHEEKDIPPNFPPGWWQVLDK
jgi:hypothetical protein